MKQIKIDITENWERYIKKDLIAIRRGGFITPVLQKIRELIKQIRKENGKKI